MKAILGEKFVQLFYPFSIDKLCEMWYNGKFGALRSWAPRSRQDKTKGRGLPLAQSVLLSLTKYFAEYIFKIAFALALCAWVSQ